MYKLIILVLCSLSLTACSLSPAYVRPDTGLPEAFVPVSATGDAASAPLTAFAPENREWWKSFNSKALPELQKMALEGNHDFAAQRWSLARTLAEVRASRSNLLPDLDFSGSASRRGSEGTRDYQVSDSFGGTMQASYELDLWGVNRDAARAGGYQALAGLNAWRGAGLSLESEVALTYFSYLSAKESLNVYEIMLANAREVLEYQKTRERLGAAAPLDVARQEAAVRNMEAERISHSQRRSEALNSLCKLLALTAMPEELAALMAEESLRDLLPPAVNAGLPSELLTRRPDIAQAEASLIAANADIGAARASFLPGISLSASFGWQSDELGSLITPASALYNLASSLLAPIFNNGRLIAQYDAAMAAREELLERYRETTLNAFWEVSTALEAGGLLLEQEKFREESRTLSQEAYRIARVRYAGGAEDFLAVISAQDSLLSADNSLTQVRLERLNSAVSLFKALGGGWMAEGNLEEMREEFFSLPAMTF